LVSLLGGGRAQFKVPARRRDEAAPHYWKYCAATPAAVMFLWLSADVARGTRPDRARQGYGAGKQRRQRNNEGNENETTKATKTWNTRKSQKSSNNLFVRVLGPSQYFPKNQHATLYRKNGFWVKQKRWSTNVTCWSKSRLPPPRYICPPHSYPHSGVYGRYKL